MGLTALSAQLFTILMRKQCFLNFWALLLKMYILEVVTFFSGLLLIQSTQSASGSTYLHDSSF